ncbi:MAG: chitobiase/beta-hexosaminidase C-terminal domain-containing protein [Eubacteriales bacterium]|nr:chitobiase/beta-hexosaminidase C-terminal domain-containing protein [Eubacteriales bacterium]
MKCPKCGIEIPEGKFYCEKCGGAVQIVPDYNPAEDIPIGEDAKQEEEAQKTAPEEPDGPRRNRRRWLRGGAAAAALVLCGLLAYRLSYRSTFGEDAVTGAAEELESEEAKLLEAPAFSLPSGTYGAAIDLTISHDQRTEGLIYYTTDGTTPDENSRMYNRPIRLEEGTTVLRAVFISSDGQQSEEGYATYQVVLAYPKEPVFSVEAGNYTEGFYVSISADADSTVYYTTNGEEPSRYSRVYGGPIYINPGLTVLQAVAIDGDGMESGIMEAIYYVEETVEEVTEETGGTEPADPSAADPAAVGQ